MEKTPDKDAILEALFLNRVKNLNWNYFEIDLKNVKPIHYRKDRGGSSSLYEAIQESSDGSFEFSPKNSPLSDEEVKNNILPELLSYMRSSPQASRNVLKRIFDANEPSVINNSGAEEGLFGKINQRTHEKRKKGFQEKIRSDEFQQLSNQVFILAEGDSWFNFPKTRPLGDAVKDIVDWLAQTENFAINCLSAGGDWLSNMVKTADYIEELDRQDTHVLLFSGGGNDLVGNNRLAKMIRRSSERKANAELTPRMKALCEKRVGENPPQSMDVKKYKKGLSFLGDDFFNFINITMSQYFLLLSELFALEKYGNLIFITHGYDFAIPSKDKRGFFVSRQHFLNGQLGSGEWLYDALVRKGIMKQEDREAILYAMIYEFNEMLIQLTQYKAFTRLYHIDCRGTANGIDDWFDELHLKSHKFKEVADTFKQTISKLVHNETPPTQKVFKVRGDLQYSHIA